MGKWSALIKQAKKKQDAENPSPSLQCGENAAKESGHGKYQFWYLFATIVNFDHLLKLDVHIFQKIPLSESFKQFHSL